MTRGRTSAIGALMAAALAVLVLVLSSGGSTYTLRAVFANVNGLTPTGKVEVAGLPVGEITGISVRVGENPVVTMQVSESYRVRDGAHAVIELGSLAGQLNRYVALTGGTGAPLPDGATIPIGRTSEPVEIDQLLSALDPRTRANLRSLLRETVRALDGHGADIELALRHSAQALRQTAGVFSDLGADGSALRTLVDRAAQGAQALAAEPGDVQGTIDRLAQLLSVTAARQDALRQSLDRLPDAMSSTRAALDAFVADLPAFRRVLAQSGPALGALDPFARQLRVSAPLSVPALQSALALVDAVGRWSPAIGRLVGPPLPRTLGQLETAVNGFNPVFDHLRARAPDALGWVPLLGESDQNYNVNGHGMLLINTSSAPPRQPITPPNCGPGWLLRPFDRIPGQQACDPWLDYVASFIGGGRAPGSYLTPAQRQGYPGEFGG